MSVAEQAAEGGDHQAGPSHAVKVGGELGEVGEPPRRILQRHGEVVGLVLGPLGVPLPASGAQQAVMLAGQGPALGAGPGRQRVVCLKRRTCPQSTQVLEHLAQRPVTADRRRTPRTTDSPLVGLLHDLRPGIGDTDRCPLWPIPPAQRTLGDPHNGGIDRPRAGLAVSRFGFGVAACTIGVMLRHRLRWARG